MVGGGEFKGTMVQQMVCCGTSNANNIMSGLRPCAEEQEESTKMPLLSSSPSMACSRGHQLLHHSSGQVPEVRDSAATSPASFQGGQEESQMPESWSQMLFRGGLVGDHESDLLSKGLEEGPMAARAGAPAYSFYGHGGGEEIQASGPNSRLSQMLLAFSPRSCITSNLDGGLLDFSNGTAPAPAPELWNQQSDNSSESNSTATASAPKKARVQAASSSGQSILKVRKEKLGDRITALHQIVSPFGKTDTASVLQETIGYIGFLLGQIEALSYPYLGHGTGASVRHQALNHGDHINASAEAARPQQDAQDGEGKKSDLRSRGMCLVPVSCITSRLGADSASDFWQPAPPLSGIILR
ncbi:transcription factor bHLH68 isoform X3 [Triticum aestivum]|uniref:transcription factor bHLH68 isoform X3 n=1 Tax=Triticum aestivum TaxID=4565 RepID=UPI001D00A46C|nr:transcription factor bHLH68-like isoform X3 [Triticum aestivum]